MNTTKRNLLKLVLALPVAAPLMASALFSKKAASVLDLSQYQNPDGLIKTFAKGDVADPYWGLYSLELAHRFGMDVSRHASLFIEWALREQRPTGRFERYCVEKGKWTACGRADSDDAVLSRWLQLLARQSPTGKLNPAWKKSFQSALAALQAMKMRSGVYSVFPPGTPGYEGYGLFKDNVEILNSFDTLTLHFKGTALSDFFKKEAAALRKAMAKNFGDEPLKLRRLAVGANYDRELFYPHAVGSPFAWLEGYFATPSSADWARWKLKHGQAWADNAKTDYPWGLMALFALQAGVTEEAKAWAYEFAGQRQRLERWNVLEETCWQIIKANT